MTLAAGTRLGPYEILSQIGAGGMGEVYRARDPRLNRDVAIKVLPASFSEDPDRLRRFEHEAKAAGVLNHPNVTAVYDIGTDAEGAPYVVQELLEGETLRAALAAGKLPPRRAVDYAIGIARGLAAAHEKGIVHRDLKPENLFVTADGNVKILDFGLAKLSEPTGVGTQTNLPTATPGTEPGVVLGTLGYMSPEQVRGKGADHRSDIFAFGAILYEMLSGNRAFRGDSAADTMSAILKEDPPELSVTNQSVSPALERVIRHCLEKTPERRLHSAHDLAFELESLTQTSGTVASLPARRSPRLARLAAVAAAVAAIVAAFLMGRRASPAPAVGFAPRTYLQLTSLSGMETSPAVSPDGQVVAFAKITNRKTHIWTQRSGGQNPTDLTPDCDEGIGWPAFSPDGNLIAYSSRCGGSGVFLIGTTGESARRLTTLGDNPAWSPDGREIVFSTESGWAPYNRATTSELWAADVATGKTRKLFAGDAVQPAVSPHALRIAYWGLPQTGSQRDVWTIPYGGLASGQTPVAVTQDAAVDWNPAWSADGRFLYFLSNRDGSMNLWRVPIDEKTGKTLGAPEPRTLPAREVGGFGLSRDGRRLAYVASELTYSLERLAIDPASGEARGQPVEVIQTSRAIASADTSPDGKLVVFDSQGSVQEDIFLAQADGTKVRHLTDDAARDRTPSFLPEGKRIVFQSDRGGNWDIWTILPDGSGLTQVTRSSIAALSPSSSPDGRRIAANDGTDVLIFELDDKGGLATERRLPRPPGTELPTAAGWTPDGRKLLVTLSRIDGTVAGLALFSLDSRSWETLPALPGMTSLASFMPPDRLVAQTLEGIVLGKLSGGPARLLAAHPPSGTYINYLLNRTGTVLTLVRVHENADIWMATSP